MYSKKFHVWFSSGQEFPQQLKLPGGYPCSFTAEGNARNAAFNLCARPGITNAYVVRVETADVSDLETRREYEATSYTLLV